jgi:putative heme iron utilization protein
VAVEHGGGGAGPQIAGDPASFPSDAELAQTLAATQRRATLCTLTVDGYPYGSAVSYSVDGTGCPVLLISEMAEHTINARHDARVSLLVAADTPDGTDPLSTARMTLLGVLQVLDDPGESRVGYLAAHPHAAYYADFADFHFWRLDVERCRYVGGFGHMSWVDPGPFRSAEVDPLAGAAEGIITHMNGDHGEANLMYVRVLAGLSDASEAKLVGVDRYGVTLQAVTPAGPRMARLRFPTPLQRADQARPAVMALLDQARAQA